MLSLVPLSLRVSGSVLSVHDCSMVARKPMAARHGVRSDEAVALLRRFYAQVRRQRSATSRRAMRVALATAWHHHAPSLTRHHHHVRPQTKRVGCRTGEPKRTRASKENQEAARARATSGRVSCKPCCYRAECAAEGRHCLVIYVSSNACSPAPPLSPLVLCRLCVCACLCLQNIVLPLRLFAFCVLSP